MRKGNLFKDKHSKNQIDIDKEIESVIQILKKLEFQLRHSWYSIWIESEDVK